MIVKNVTKVHILKTLANSPRVLCIVYHPEGLPAFFDYTNTLSLPQGGRPGGDAMCRGERQPIHRATLVVVLWMGCG